MITVKNADDFLNRIGIDSNFTVADSDLSRDIISVFDPDLKFDDVMWAIYNYLPYRGKIVDNGSGYVQVDDTLYIDGCKTLVSYYCQCGESGFGTLFKIMVKSVQCPINGEIKTFLSFGDMKAYKDRLVVE